MLLHAVRSVRHATSTGAPGVPLAYDAASENVPSVPACCRGYLSVQGGTGVLCCVRRASYDGEGLVNKPRSPSKYCDCQYGGKVVCVGSCIARKYRMQC